LRALPLLTAAALFLGLEAPDSLPSATAFAVAAAGTLLLSCAITTLLTISLLWTVSGQGITNIVSPAVMIFSGSIVPLPFFPDWAQPVLSFLPFRGLLDTPFRLYMGHIPPGDLMLHLGHQLVWVAVLILVGRWLLSRGQRRMTIQGG
jgi:ABC-2 type transport system permease protein